MTERRQRGATESLLQVTFAVEGAAILFGGIAIGGLHKDHVLEVVIAGGLLLAMLALAGATLSRGVNPIVFASQALLLAPVAIEPLWAVAWLVCAIFFTYCLVTGRRLDRRKEQR